MKIHRDKRVRSNKLIVKSVIMALTVVSHILRLFFDLAPVSDIFFVVFLVHHSKLLRSTFLRVKQIILGI